MEEAITGDFALIKAWKADKETFYAFSITIFHYKGFLLVCYKNPRNNRTWKRLEISCSVKQLAISMSQCALPEKLPSLKSKSSLMKFLVCRLIFSALFFLSEYKIFFS